MSCFFHTPLPFLIFFFPVIALIQARRHNMVLSIKHLDRETRVLNSFSGSFPDTEIGGEETLYLLLLIRNLR